VATNKRYAGAAGFTISECADKVAKDIGKIDILVGALSCSGFDVCHVLGVGVGRWGTTPHPPP